MGGVHDVCGHFYILLQECHAFHHNHFGERTSQRQCSTGEPPDTTDGVGITIIKSQQSSHQRPELRLRFPPPSDSRETLRPRGLLRLSSRSLERELYESEPELDDSEAESEPESDDDSDPDSEDEEEEEAEALDDLTADRHPVSFNCTGAEKGSKAWR
jgi:hypothetical protein